MPRVFCKSPITAIAFSIVAFWSTQAASFLLNNGPGDGSVTVQVDEFGSFGSAVGSTTDDAIFDPVGPIDPAGTTFESGIAIGILDSLGANIGPRTFMTSGDIGGSSGGTITGAISGDNLGATSSFTFGDLSIDLTQTLNESFDNGARTGSLLDQRYSITNTSNQRVHFDIVRYLDGDLFFDQSIQDGGGRIEIAGNDILFETDAASGSEAEATFIGITGVGGTAPTTNRFEISEFSELRSNILDGNALGDFVQNDVSEGEPVPDQFISTAFDVTMALRNEFWLDPNETGTYQTQTLFGNAVPPAPGSSEALPLLPPVDEPPFIFEVDQPGGQTIWFDPPVSIGFEYEILTGPLFASVTLPTIVQTDDFEILIFDGSDFVSQGLFAPGTEFDFTALNPSGISLFQILGIDPNLGLDPDDPLAFPTGLSFVSAGPVSFSQTPITVDVDVPEPSALGLVLVGLTGLVVLRRRRRETCS